MTNHCVFGAGLIGGYLTGALLACKQSVSVVARPRVQDKLRNGLILTDLDNHRVEVPPPHFAQPADPLADFAWLTVKCTAVESAISDLREYIGTGTVILCCQNGLGSERLVKQAFPDNTVLRVMVPFNVAELEDNHLHRGSGGDLIIEYHAKVQALSGTIDTPLMGLHLSRDMDATLWAKLQLNLINALNALADIPVRDMLHERGYRRVFAACMRELLAVTEKRGMRLPKLTALPATWLPGLMQLPDWLFQRLARPMLEVDPTVRTSMWWDLSQGKPTEIDHLNGAVVQAGKDHNVPTPVNENVIRLIRAVEKGDIIQGFTAEGLLRELGVP